MKKPSFGELVTAARKRLNLSQPALAKRVGVTKTTIYRIERRGQVARGDLFLRLAKALEQPASYFGGEQKAKRPSKLVLFETVSTLKDHEADALLSLVESFLSGLHGKPSPMPPPDPAHENSDDAGDKLGDS